MKPSNRKFWQTFLDKAYTYISTLTDNHGKLLTTSRRKTPFIGFLTAIKSVQDLFDDLVQNGPLQYLLTYKLSQDHLELFFGAVRSSFGCNNNPTVRQFISAYKRLLMRHEIKGGSGNVAIRDSTTILYVTRDSIPRNDAVTDTLTASLSKRYNLENDDLEDLTESPNLEHISNYKRAAIGYMAGFVVKMVTRRTKCPTCLSALVMNAKYSSAQSQQLIDCKDRGGLVRPADDVVYICETTEQYIQRMLTCSSGKLPQATGVSHAISAAVLNHVAYNAIFDQLYEHMLDSTADNNHVFSLIKCVSHCFCKIRFHHLAKTFTAKLTGAKVRKQLTKLVLFKHQ